MSRAHAIHRRLELLIPSVEEYFISEIYSREELQHLFKRRTDFEYKLASRPLLLLDVRNALGLERSVELRVEEWCTETGNHLKHRWIVVKRIQSIFEGALAALKGDDRHELEREYIDFLKQYQYTTRLSNYLAEQLRLRPREPLVWVTLIDWACEEERFQEARSFVQDALRRMETSQELWTIGLNVELKQAGTLLRVCLASGDAEEIPDSLSPVVIQLLPARVIARAALKVAAASQQLDKVKDCRNALLELTASYGFTAELRVDIAARCLKEQLKIVEAQLSSPSSRDEDNSDQTRDLYSVLLSKSVIELFALCSDDNASGILSPTQLFQALSNVTDESSSMGPVPHLLLPANKRHLETHLLHVFIRRLSKHLKQLRNYSFHLMIAMFLAKFKHLPQKLRIRVANKLATPKLDVKRLLKQTTKHLVQFVPFPALTYLKERWSKSGLAVSFFRQISRLVDPTVQSSAVLDTVFTLSSCLDDAALQTLNIRALSVLSSDSNNTLTSIADPFRIVSLLQSLSATDCLQFIEQHVDLINTPWEVQWIFRSVYVSCQVESDLLQTQNHPSTSISTKLDLVSRLFGTAALPTWKRIRPDLLSDCDDSDEEDALSFQKKPQIPSNNDDMITSSHQKQSLLQQSPLECILHTLMQLKRLVNTSHQRRDQHLYRLEGIVHLTRQALLFVLGATQLPFPTFQLQDVQIDSLDESLKQQAIDLLSNQSSFKQDLEETSASLHKCYQQKMELVQLIVVQACSIALNGVSERILARIAIPIELAFARVYRDDIPMEWLRCCRRHFEILLGFSNTSKQIPLWVSFIHFEQFVAKRFDLGRLVYRKAAEMVDNPDELLTALSS